MEVDVSSKCAERVFGGLPRKKFEISGSEKCILVDPGDGFAMDNGESKKPQRSDRGVWTPLDPPLYSPLQNRLAEFNVMGIGTVLHVFLVG